MWNLVKRGPGHCCWRTLWFLKLVPWRRMLCTMTLDFKRSKISKMSTHLTNNVADAYHVWSDSEHKVNIVGIYVENHDALNRECFIWIRLVALPPAEGEGVRSTLLQGKMAWRHLAFGTLLLALGTWRWARGTWHLALFARASHRQS